MQLAKHLERSKSYDTTISIFPGTSMACPHVCGLIADLLDKNDGYDKVLLKDDEALRKLLKKKFLIDIGVTGPDNETGLGFLTFLTNVNLTLFYK